MSTSVVVDLWTFLFNSCSVSALLLFWELMQHETSKKTPDFSQIFPPLGVFVSHQSVNLKGRLSHVLVRK